MPNAAAMPIKRVRILFFIVLKYIILLRRYEKERQK
jgi:hypothetical protein